MTNYELSTRSVTCYVFAYIKNGTNGIIFDDSPSGKNAKKELGDFDSFERIGIQSVNR